ncbi:MAG: hypothetical protein Q4A48_01690 [Bacillota bacterium]|nr:hypothetical protein [Bacillota bacterium]
MKNKLKSGMIFILVAVFALSCIFPFDFGGKEQSVYAAEVSSDSKSVGTENEGDNELISIADAEIELGRTQYVYSGTAKKPYVDVYYDGWCLQKDVDYTVRYWNNVNVGTAVVIITGIGDYTDEATCTFKITRKALQKNKVTIPSSSFLYTGNRIKPKVTVKNGQKKLVKGKDYSVSYRNNRRIGTARVIVKGKGNFRGTVTKKFRIKKYFRLYKSKYSKFIQGKVTKSQLSRILSSAMYRYTDRQTINRKRVSNIGRPSYAYFHQWMFRKLKSYQYEWDDYDGTVSCKIEDANRLLSSFASFRYKPNRTYADDVYTDSTHVYIWDSSPRVDTCRTKIVSAKRYARKIEVVFKYGGEFDNYIDRDGYEGYRTISEKYVAVLKKQSNGKYKLVKINLRDSYGMKTVTKKKYKKIIKGSLSKKQLKNVLSGIMQVRASVYGTTKTISKKKIRKAGLWKKNKYHMRIYAQAFVGIKRLRTANRILSSFTSFRFKKHRLYKTNHSEFYAKTSSKKIRVSCPMGEAWPAKIKSAKYNSKKMVVLFTWYVGYDYPYEYNYKAILKKDKSKRFKLVKIQKTIPCR